MRALVAVLVTVTGLFFAAPAHGQCVRENIAFYGTICSKTYATVRTPDGRYLNVPVINGYLPSIDETTDDCGVTTRTYTYNSGVRYVAGTIPNYSNRNSCSSSTTTDTYRKPYTLPAPRVSESVTYNRPPTVTESRTRLPQIRVEESSSFDDDDDYDRKRKPYTAPAPSTSSWGGTSQSTQKALDEIKSIREDLRKIQERYDKQRELDAKERELEAKKPVTLPAPASTKDSKELETAKKSISDLQEEVRKLKELTLKYEAERKAREAKEKEAPPAPPQTTTTTPGMVRPSELGKKKD